MQTPKIHKWSEKFANEVNTKRKVDAFCKKRVNRKYRYDSQRRIGDAPDYDFDGDYGLLGWYDIQCGDR